MTKNWTSIKGALSGFSRVQLVGLVQDLYRADPKNQDFLHARFLVSDGGTDLTPYKTCFARVVPKSGRLQTQAIPRVGLDIDPAGTVKHAYGHAADRRCIVSLKIARESRPPMKNEPEVVRDITEDEVHSYVRDGWVFLPGLVELECAAALLAASKEIMGETGNDWVARHGKDAQLGHWQDRHFLARDGIEPFRSLAHAEGMGRAAKKLMERNVEIRYWADMIAVKLPIGSAAQSTATPLHQDYSNKHFDRTGNVTFWLALEDIPAEKGTCRYRSGSHMLGPLGHEFGRKHPGGTGMDIHDVYPWLAERCPLSEPRDMRAGDVTAHGGLTLHGAPENRTDSPRWAYIAIYIPGDALWTGSPFLGLDGADIEIGQQFDHPYFPVVCD